ncbi:hypothetical protein MSAN_00293200 [Mycena sanguinolenta]|uniref:Uncharacterized protein n=1 Tax=Mycena sanguinolenta TaxID=230812 RepID=A0A8H6ZEF4_9AGAR|nr:hypothetical protein MSAN_00293200 [Mycena sanguinolenta]
MSSESTDDDLRSRASSESLESQSYGGAIFSGSQNFTVSGGTFTNIAKNYSTFPAVPSDIRTIPLGDIDLQREMCLVKKSVILEQHRSVRKLYCAKIDGRTAGVTVATYQGDYAEDVRATIVADTVSPWSWAGMATGYNKVYCMSIRHPNIIQICGTASSGNIHATIFHDELIPLQDFLRLHRNSHFATVYIYAHTGTEFKEVQAHFLSVFRRDLYGDDCTFFIRRSTGRLCTDLMPSGLRLGYPGCIEISRSQGLNSLGEANMEAGVIESLTLEQYHEVCFWDLSRRRYVSAISRSGIVNLGAVMFWPSAKLSDMVEVAHLPTAELDLSAYRWYTTGEQVGTIMEDGWTRFTSDNAVGTIMWLWVHSNHAVSWLSQANHIFSRVGISSNFQDYAVLKAFRAELEIRATTADPPKGFLFLCPPKDLQLGASFLKWPQRPAYWSFDPLGIEQLDMEDAAHLGFPSVQLFTEILAKSWDTSVYAGLRQFHQAKGFDPDSRDIAQHMGHDLYHSSHASFAHIYSDDPQVDHPSQVITEKESAKSLGALGTDISIPQTTLVDQKLDHYRLQEQTPISWTFKSVMNVQLALIFFLLLFWLYDQVCEGQGPSQLDGYSHIKPPL